MSELKPCPFCGGKAYIEREGTRRQSCIIECRSCGARLESGEEGGTCGIAWNCRAASAAPAESVVVPMKLVQLLEVVRKDGVLKRSSELQEAFRLLDGSTIKGDGHADK